MSVERCIHGCVAVVPLLCLSLGIGAARADWPELEDRIEHHAPGRAAHPISSPDGRFIASLDAAGVVVWSVEEGQRVPIITAVPLNDLALGPRNAIGAGADGHVHLWSLATGEAVARLPTHARSVTRVSVDARGRVVAGDVDGGVSVWDAAGGLLLRSQLGTAITDVALSGDLVYIRGSGRCRVLDLASGAPVDALDGSVRHSPGPGFRCALSSDASGLELG